MQDLVLNTVIYISMFFSIFMIYTFIEHKNTLKNPPLPKKLPKVTVIVPAYNEEKDLDFTMHSLLNLDYPKNKLQLIIVDDGSTDNTLELAKKYKKLGVLVLHKENGGKGSALNYGLKHATGEIIACLDVDSYVARDALKKMIGHFSDPNVTAVTPSLKIWRPRGIFGRIQQTEFMLGVFLRKTFAILNCILVTPGPFSLFRKEFFDKHGGYDEKTITEDTEISLRMLYHRYKVENSIDAAVFTKQVNNFGVLWGQRIRWYVGFMDNVIKYKKMWHPNYGIVAFFAYPMAFVSVIMSIVVFIPVIYKFFSQVIESIVTLITLNFDLISFSKSITIDWFLIIPFAARISVLTILFSVTLAMLFIAHRTSKDKSKMGLSFLVFAVAYLFFFSIWWVSAFYYKIFGGKNLRFGGVKWDRSLRSHIAKSIKRRLFSGS